MNRTIHRVLGIFAGLLLLWIAGTGVGMQVLDLKAILAHEPQDDPQELSMQEGMYGPNGFALIQVSDFSAPALPDGFDYNRAIGTVLQAVHAQQNPGSGAGAGIGPGVSSAGASGVGGGQVGRAAGGPNGAPGGSPNGGPGGGGPGGRRGGLALGSGAGPGNSPGSRSGGASAEAAPGGENGGSPGSRDPGAGGPRNGGGRGGRGQMSSDDRVAAIDQAVTLTADQKTKIKAIYDANEKKAADIRAAQDPDMRAKLTALRADQSTYIEAVLTAAQKPKYEAYLATSEPQGRGPGGGGQGNGGPGGSGLNNGDSRSSALAAAGAAGSSNRGPGSGRQGGPSGGSGGRGPDGGPGGGQAGGGPRGGDAAYNPLSWVELRMSNGIPIGQAMVGTRLEAFNALTGDPVEPVPTKTIPQGGALPPSLRQRLKTWHRFWNRQDTPGVYVEFIAGIILWTMTVSGLIMYFRLWGTRWKQDRPQPFWLTGGGWWRAWHRVISTLAAAFLLWMSFTGTWIGFESSYGPIKRVFASKPIVLQPTAAQVAAAVSGAGVPGNGGQEGPVQQPAQPGGGPNGGRGPGGAGRGPGGPGQPGGRGGGGRGNALDFVLPLRDTEVRQMTAVTLNSMKQIHPTLTIKAIRLRTYGQTKQGVVVTGGGQTTNQYVFNADSGQPASLNEQGYPVSGFPFGTQVHENIKHLHSGDYFGIPARLMNLFAGFSLAFLSISGIFVYVDMWLKRRKGGRKNPIWL